MKYDARKEYERERERREREREQGGCGNPNCSMCYNPDGTLTAAARGSRIDGPSSSYDIGPAEMPSYDPNLGMSDREVEERRREMARRMEEQISRYISPFRPGGTSYVEPVDPLAEVRKPIEKYLVPTDRGVDWDDVVGNDRAREELREAIEASTTHAELYRFYDRTPPKGVLLYGPPGCGKTMFGKAAATAIGKLFGKKSELLLINGAEIESPILAIAGQKINALFTYARKYKEVHKVPLVIFIDEADALLRNRTRFPISTELVSAFLAEMDGLNDCGAFVILASNLPDDIDEALLRDGRCERKIKIERPGPKEVKTILEKQFANAPAWASGPFNLDQIVEYLWDNDFLLQELENPVTLAKHRFLLGHIISGAMVVGLLSRAKGIAFRRDVATGKPSGVRQADLFDAVMQIYEENRGLTHLLAMKEFIREVALPAEALKGLN